MNSHRHDRLALWAAALLLLVGGANTLRIDAASAWIHLKPADVANGKIVQNPYEFEIVSKPTAGGGTEFRVAIRPTPLSSQIVGHPLLLKTLTVQVSSAIEEADIAVSRVTDHA